MKDAIRWDRSYDVIVAGSGASGMSAALTAHFEGLEVLLLEKADKIGGSTAVSGGAVWLPLNADSEGAGHPDTYEKAWEYLDNTVGNAAPDTMKRAFLSAGPAMYAYMVSHGVLRLAARTYSPDYYPDRPGAAMGGRSLDPVEFDGRKLGKNFTELRDPLNEFLVLGGMMVNITDVYHLLGAKRSVKSFRHGSALVLRYWTDRLRGYHRGTRLLLGNALAAQLFHAVLKNGISYWLKSPVCGIHQDESGRILGVRVQTHGGMVNVQARKGLVIATGGFPWNAELRAEHYPQPTGQWSMAPQANAGEGIRLALSAGAAMGENHVSPAFWAPVSILEQKDGTQVRYPHLVWDRAKPGLIAVDGIGARFVNESTSYHEFVNAMYERNKRAPCIPAYLICDHDFIEKWGLGLALPGGRPRQHLIDAGYLIQCGTVADLAQRLAMDPPVLEATVARYNEMVEQGSDDDFGKGSTAYNRYLGAPAHSPNPCLGPVRTGPFYAVKVVAGDIGTACGVSTNEHAQALRADGTVIEGLYVAGNDMQSVMGGAYPAPGITLGPGLTFGWVAAQHLAHDAGVQSA
jgi:succinate dehydrogenase/fumarate reductase flavoprotein subunit